MRRLLLAGIAALSVLSASAAHATGPDECAIVLKTRDGFLNIREAPTMKSKIIAKISSADIVHDDAYETLIGEFDNPHYEGWTHIDRVLRSSGDKKWQKLRGVGRHAISKVYLLFHLPRFEFVRSYDEKVVLNQCRGAVPGNYACASIC